MRYIFFGTPRFAEIILEGLIRAGMPPAALVCNPDRPVGRKKVLTAPPSKKLAAGSGNIKIFQPEKLADLAAITPELSALSPDFFVVAAYSKIIPKSVLEIPRLGVLGVHPSLLPRYRGASPIQSAILQGEPETGVTIYLLDEKTDHGLILSQETVKGFDAITPISNLGYLALEEKLANLSAELLITTIPGFLKGNIALREQDESQATYTKKFKTSDGFVDGNDLKAAISGDREKAEEVLRKINAFNPEPGAWTLQDGKRTKLLEAEIKNNALVLRKTQREGEKPKNH